ncbi:tetratricopeptide repeat protein [Methanospirillum sp. J.3.6.1-F.2.7.3]|uniref:Tetratricopeptide repeat protein n=1 Tax=Methanospirillum purgamenti TaxID=2834276 RepID=A0A8E7AXU6_9EURY|nr:MULTISPECIES: tetratricopeptide repeat protein [Methanospirillum]MDX8551759.1 tetratricopeptide repeat protein [Methanospirillum hungatei]QVV89722.1 tetratricopeptide repeat protein [Methanospirillum sp. J.3.6.1-F.2.7.3]
MDDLFKIGLQKYRESKYAEARDLFLLSIQNDDSNPKTWNALGICYTKLGQIDEASNCYDTALMLDPGNATYEKNLRIVNETPTKIKAKNVKSIQKTAKKEPQIKKIITSIFLFCIFFILLQWFIGLGIYLIGGVWPSIVVMEAESMAPNMNVGDLILVVAGDRFGTLQSLEEGNISGNEKFGLPGDVIIYRPNGNTELQPIIHRAMTWVEEGEEILVTAGMRTGTYTAPHAGYLTKGDNNPVIDQVGWSNYRNLGGPIEPVKKEWIIGKTFFKIPLFGYISLNAVPFLICVGILFFIILWLRRK